MEKLAALISAGRRLLPRAEKPRDASVYVHAGALFLKAGNFADAKEQYERAIAADPSSKQAHAGLYYALTGLGDQHNAAAHLGHALQLQAIVALPYRGTNPPIPILVILSINAGNVLIQRFLDDHIFQTYIVFVEFYESHMPLPPHQLVINAIGDADVRTDALLAAKAILSHTDAPVINPPAAVQASGRCENANRLAGVPGVITPLAITFSRRVLEAGDPTSMLASCDLNFPLLVRAPGYHMGKHFLRLETASELTAALAELPGEELIFMQYLDSRGADGNVRKYRVLMIDGRLYPVHLAISSHWKIHYFSAEMAERPEHRAEEARFLADMPGTLGPKAMAALQQIQSILGLDYAGIDFGLNKDGDILLFEANATMAVYRPDASPEWDYRRVAIEHVYTAVRQLLQSRASASSC